MARSLFAACALLLLAGCSQADQGTGDVAKEPQQAASVAAAPVRMAYSYSYRFSVPDATVSVAQARHVAMCDRLGAARCRVLETHRSTGEYGSASLKLEVASAAARPFTAGLSASVEALGGELVSDDVQAEDLGRQIVDVEARLRAKEALVARLEAALRTRPGSTADLVATEKAVADAQGEMEAVRAQLKTAQGRIATSPVEIVYERRQSFATQVGDAFGAVGSTLSSSVVALIYFLAAAVPWAIVGSLLFLAVRAALRRLRRRRKAAPPA